MNSPARRRGLWILVVIALAVVVGAAAYSFGVGAGHGGAVVAGPFGMHFGRVSMGYGFGWFGVLGPLLFMLLLIGLLAWVLAPPGRDGGRRESGPPIDRSGRGSVEQLTELARLHETGALTDEEFAAAKRRLLGL